MAAGKLDITIEIGATFSRTVTWEASSVRVDLTDYTAKMHIRDRVGGTVLLTLTTENGRIFLEDTEVNGDETGVVRLTIAADDTDSIVHRSGSYDLKLYAPSGDETRLLEGTVQFSPAVTIDDED